MATPGGFYTPEKQASDTKRINENKGISIQ
jgi:hypothetical protein